MRDSPSDSSVVVIASRDRGPVRLLGISGSLRSASSNTALLRAAAALAPAQVEITIYEGLARLPLFNPDLEGKEPSAVADFRARIRQADGILIASPEYAHGMTGALKNALDWLVGGFEFVDKPVALLNASPNATQACAALAETVTAMSARLIADASATIPLPNNRYDAAKIAADSALATILRSSVEAFAIAIRQERKV